MQSVEHKSNEDLAADLARQRLLQEALSLQLLTRDSFVTLLNDLYPGIGNLDSHYCDAEGQDRNDVRMPRVHRLSRAG